MIIYIFAFVFLTFSFSMKANKLLKIITKRFRSSISKNLTWDSKFNWDQYFYNDL
jgi:hypothetical protein